jgi:Predicted acyltransferases
MVFLCHNRMAGLLPAKWADNTLFWFISDGNLAVYLFIIVSGYCISQSVKRKIADTTSLTLSLSSTILKRYFRLALPCAVVLLCTGLAYWAGAFSFKTHSSLPMHRVAEEAYGEGLEVFGLAKSLILSPLGMDFGWLAPLWMMKYIFIGTMLVIIIELAIVPFEARKSFLIILFSMLLAACVSKWYAGIIVGILLSHLQKLMEKIKHTSILSLVLFSLGLFTWLEADCLRGGGHFISSSLIVSSVLVDGPISKIFSSLPLRELGSISYPVYLLHWPVICSIPFALNNIVPSFATFFISLFVILLLAFGLARIERYIWRTLPL